MLVVLHVPINVIAAFMIRWWQGQYASNANPMSYSLGEHVYPSQLTHVRVCSSTIKSLMYFTAECVSRAASPAKLIKPTPRHSATLV